VIKFHYMIENSDGDKLSRRDLLKVAGVLGTAAAVVGSGDKIIDAAKKMLPDTLSSIRGRLDKSPQGPSPVSIAQYDRVVEKISSFSTEPRTLMTGIIGSAIIRTFNERKAEPAEQYDKLNKILNTSEFWLAIYDSISIRYYPSAYPLDEFINDSKATYTHASSVYFDISPHQRSLPDKSDIDRELLQRLMHTTVESVTTKLSKKQSDVIGRILSEDKKILKTLLMEKLERILHQY